MATHGDLSMFTHGKLVDMALTYGELENLSKADLLKIANEKLVRFKTLPDEFEIPAAIAVEAGNLCAPKDPPNKWTKPVSEKLFDAFLDLVTDPAKVLAFVLLLDKILKH